MLDVRHDLTGGLYGDARCWTYSPPFVLLHYRVSRCIILLSFQMNAELHVQSISRMTNMLLSRTTSNQSGSAAYIHLLQKQTPSKQQPSWRRSASGWRAHRKEKDRRGRRPKDRETGTGRSWRGQTWLPSRSYPG